MGDAVHGRGEPKALDLASLETDIASGNGIGCGKGPRIWNERTGRG